MQGGIECVLAMARHNGWPEKHLGVKPMTKAMEQDAADDR